MLSTWTDTRKLQNVFRCDYVIAVMKHIDYSIGSSETKDMGELFWLLTYCNASRRQNLKERGSKHI